MSLTINYYNTHAQLFSDNTREIDFTEVQDGFLSKLPSNSVILDFGCGSGRDTKYFLSKGYAVDAIDGSEEICLIASEYTGIIVKHMCFEELDEKEKYDGIWACASILHLDSTMLRDVFVKMSFALKPGGVIYTSFKYGDFEGMRQGRYFTDFTEASFDVFMEKIPCKEMRIEEEWISVDARAERSDEKWLNVILRKSKIR